LVSWAADEYTGAAGEATIVDVCVLLIVSVLLIPNFAA
jgi:hypothetical protein